MIEALACGVPVVAFRGGSVPEVIDDGVTGFIVDSLEDAIAATQRVHHLDRRRCREVFERRFTATRMARDHVALYEQLLERRSRGRALTGVV
jgi:glycosyltransferase involved in cell wall biosynthesis